MKIKTAQSALLTNHEVLLHLQTESAEYEGTDGTRRRRWPPNGTKEILKDTIAYLTNPDYSTNTYLTTHPTRPLTLYIGPYSLLRALAPKYRLNKTEYLQLYNVRPRTQVALQLVIEEASARFTEEELEDILRIVVGVFETEEGAIPEGVEEEKGEKVGESMLGVSARKRGRKKA